MFRTASVRQGGTFHASGEQLASHAAVWPWLEYGEVVSGRDAGTEPGGRPSGIPDAGSGPGGHRGVADLEGGHGRRMGGGTPGRIGPKHRGTVPVRRMGDGRTRGTPDPRGVFVHAGHVVRLIGWPGARRPRAALGAWRCVSCSFQNRTGVVFKTGLFRQLRAA